MTSCACCNRGFNREYARENNYCPLCTAKGCTAVGAKCGMPEPKQDPTETRDLPQPGDLEDEDIDWSDFSEPDHID